MIRPIAISLSPNLEDVDVWNAVRMFFSPRQWLRGEYIQRLEQWFRQFFGISYAVSFSSARGALIAILRSFGVKEKDEVILQAFTCVAVPNAAIALRAKPVYVDINSAYTIDVADLERKITKKTKAIIVQHTFGIPAQMRKIRLIAKKHNLLVVEDCAHIIGGVFEKRKLGTIGDAAVFSFGRDKAFSSVSGGMAITNNKILGAKIRQFQKIQEFPNIFWIFQQLCHPVAFFFILPLYNVFYLGKILLFVLQKMRLLSFPVQTSEKEGKTNEQYMKKMPNVLAMLAFFQLKRLNKFNSKRVELVRIYKEILGGKTVKDIAHLRYPFLIKKRDAFLEILKDKGIYLGKWYSEIIDPKGTNLATIFYQRGSCPNAEKFARTIINLPTYPTLKTEDAKKIALLVKQYVTNQRD